MADMKLYIELLARSTGLKRELRDSETGFRRFGSVAQGEMARIRQAAGSLQGKLAGLGLTIGAVQQLSLSANLDKGLIQIKQTAGEAGDSVKGLRKEFFDMSRDTGRDVDKIKTGFDSLIQSGQSWKSALESTRGINIASAVSGANESVLAKGLTVGAEQFNFDLEKPGQALVLLDKMTVAGRLGSAEVENLSGIFARVGANAAEAQFGFDKTLAFIETLSKVEKEPERLATLADSTLRVFTNLRYMAAAQKGTGIKFFDDKGGRRDPVEVLKDISKRYKALKTDQERAVFMERALGKADLDTQKGMRTLLKGNALNNMEKFTASIGDAGGTLQRDLPEAVSNAVDQAGRLKSVLRKAADDFVQPINKTIADWTQFMLDKKENGGLELSGKQIVGGTAAIVTGTYLAARAGNAVLGEWTKKKMGSFGMSTAIGVAEGKALQAATGVTPVFVTNWPGSGLPGSGLPMPGNPTGKAGINFGKYLVPAAMYSLPVAVAAAPFISSYIGERARENGWGTQTFGRGSKEYDVMGIGGRNQQFKNEFKIDVHFDEMGKAFTKVNSMNTSVKTGGNRGDFFSALTSTEAM
jgi:TP901 family phage tail tape measure protein